MAVQVVGAKIDETSQEIAWNLGGQVTKCDHREYGSAKMKINKVGGKDSVDALFQSLGDEMQVHPDFLSRVRRDKFISETGLDVPWRSAFGTSKRFSCYRSHTICALCCPRS